MSDQPEPEPEYVEARRVLLDALEALSEHRAAVVVVGAQAIYLNAGRPLLPIADLTTDADLTLDPALLSPSPELETALTEAGFRHVEHGGALEPGSWETEATVRGMEGTIPLDLIVPATAAPGGRRSTDLGPHGTRAARRSAGLEATLVDSAPMTVAALDPADPRAATARVAGLASMLIAKSYKIAERVDQGDDDRTSNKDASDVVRIIQAMPPAEMADRLAQLRANPAAGPSTVLGLEHFDRLFGRRNGPGIALAIAALERAMPEERVRAICLAYAGELRAAL